MDWVWARASSIGKSHMETGDRKQDAYSCFNKNGIFAGVLSDGAGSAKKGGEGASVATRTLISLIRAHFRESSLFPSDAVLTEWAKLACSAIAKAAKQRDLLPRDFACTLIIFISNGDKSLVLQVGDGCATVKDVETGEWIAMCWPAQGEYASMTYFLTDQPEPKIRISHSSRDIAAAAIFTDGLERLALDFSTKVPYSRFLEPLILPLQKDKSSGHLGGLSKLLENYLGSSEVCSRTDDDKTLVLALYR